MREQTVVLSLSKAKTNVKERWGGGGGEGSVIHCFPFKPSSIDASEALAMPGVTTFICANDVPGQNRRLWFNNVEELFAEEEVSTH